jgi:hypothetical protein
VSRRRPTIPTVMKFSNLFDWRNLLEGHLPQQRRQDRGRDVAPRGAMAPPELLSSSIPVDQLANSFGGDLADVRIATRLALWLSGGER